MLELFLYQQPPLHHLLIFALALSLLLSSGTKFHVGSHIWVLAVQGEDVNKGWDAFHMLIPIHVFYESGLSPIC